MNEGEESLAHSSFQAVDIQGLYETKTGAPSWP